MWDYFIGLAPLSSDKSKRFKDFFVLCQIEGEILAKPYLLMLRLEI